jgi:hypothetical protein
MCQPRGAVRQPWVQPVPRTHGRRAIQSSVGVGCDVGFAPGGRVTEHELLAVAAGPASGGGGAGRGRAVQDPVRAHPHLYRDREVAEQEREAGPS